MDLENNEKWLKKIFENLRTIEKNTEVLKKQFEELLKATKDESSSEEN